MKRAPAQQVSVVAAVLCASAPLGIGLFRYANASDSGLLWMALVPSLLTAGVLAATIGRRRPRRSVRVQSLVILCLTTLFAGVAGVLFAEMPSPGVWVLALGLGICLAAASVFVALGRADAA